MQKLELVVLVVLLGLAGVAMAGSECAERQGGGGGWQGAGS